MSEEKKQKESSQERFKRVVEKRVNKALNVIRTLGNCANKRVYGYTDEQIEKIFDTIQQQVEKTKAKFATDKKTQFKL